MQEHTGAFLIPPYNFGPVIAGQGTMALELLEQVCGSTSAHGKQHWISIFQTITHATASHPSILCSSLQVPDLDAIIVPVSGGGMIAGIAVAAKGLKPSIKMIAAEPTGVLPDQASLLKKFAEVHRNTLQSTCR